MNLSSVVDAVFRLVNREVWIVTAALGSRRGGLAATWFAEASLDRERPVVLAGIAPNHYTAELIDASGAFAAHMLAAESAQHGLSFAIGSGRTRDKFDGLRVGHGQTGSPILMDCLAWLDCRVFARLDAGDRLYFWAEVIAAERVATDQPLREHDLFAAANDDQKRLLRANRDEDMLLQRPLAQHWRAHLPMMLKPR